ncbi:hypothetical protein [Actinomadura kijaniata]|uniref:hypothetical protein n=1 Tax=Actinomadura kijaniata TaxID=46161 RepID=UPI000831CBD1|nr:hypothetical protein [Actinomadura kijaniata]
MEAAPAGRTPWWSRNVYVIEGGDVRVCFGGEIRDVGLTARYRDSAPAVDVALLPVNGLRALGARALVPVHDAHDEKDLPSRLVRRHGPARDAVALAGDGLEVVPLPTGRRWVRPAGAL